LRYLLDTHLFLWGIALPDRLPPHVRELADADGNQAYASAVAIWEIAIKHARNRGRPDDMPITGQQALRLSEAAQIPLLEIQGEHAAEVDNLPLLHADPFDRLLVAQARYEEMTLLTHDKKLAAYGDFVMVV
jgi:PIN domain nuclease of toxin-antitoxin system